VIVIDASVVAELILDLPRAGAIRAYLARAGAAVELAAPHLLDAEVGSALRKLVLREVVRASRALAALGDLATFPVLRHDHVPLLSRAFELRDHLSFCDALYVALAEALGAVLLTLDRGPADLPGARVRIEWIGA
jgi:predicted nucleic acid-binding protein